MTGSARSAASAKTCSRRSSSAEAATARVVLQHGERDLRLAERPRPRPGAGEVLLHIRAVTICASALIPVIGVAFAPLCIAHQLAATMLALVYGVYCWNVQNN